VSGEKIGAFGLTEPNAGSDVSAMETTATPDGDHYVLNGSKVYIANANVADIFVVAAKTAPEWGAIGISLFIVEKGMEGLSVSGVSERKLAGNAWKLAQANRLSSSRIPPSRPVQRFACPLTPARVMSFSSRLFFACWHVVT
jgi:hypothetical protein